MTAKTLAALALTVALLPARYAAAQNQDAGSMGGAIQLFDEAEKLSGQGEHAQACPKYAESYRLDQQIGVLLKLAACYETLNKLASAWASYRAAQELAEKRGDERAATAQTSAVALESRLSRLVIRVPEGSRGVAVLRNGAPVNEASWGTPVAVDPGAYLVEARAPGRPAFVREVEVKDNGALVEVNVVLPDADTAREERRSKTSTKPSPPERKALSRFTTPVWASGGVTLLLGAGTVATGVVYLSKRSEFHDANDGRGPTTQKQELRDAASTWGIISTVLGAATAVGAGATTYFYVSGGSRAEPTAVGRRAIAIDPWWGPGTAGIHVGGAL